MFEEAQLDKVLDQLSEREAGVISIRFGLTDGMPRTLGEVGRIYGVKGLRIAQIQDKAMKKLRELAPDYFGVRAEGNEGGLIGFIDVRGTFIPEKTELVLVVCEFCGQERQVGVKLAVPWSGGTFIQAYGTCATGRPRKYCSNKCRQAAYRIRKAQTTRRRQGE